MKGQTIPCIGLNQIHMGEGACTVLRHWQKRPSVQILKQSHLPENFGVLQLVPAGAEECQVIKRSQRLASPAMLVHCKSGIVTEDLP